MQLLGELLDLREDGPRPLLNLSDSWTASAGLEWTALDRLKVRGGYRFTQTPVPRQTGAKSLLDNSVHTLSVGLGIVVGTIFGIHRAPVTLDLAFQTQLLSERSATKAPADPVGSLRHGGRVYGLAVAVHHAY